MKQGMPIRRSNQPRGMENMQNARSTRSKGAFAEALVVAALMRAGHTVIDRNWACPLGEIDLITRHNDEIVMVEVRARTDGIDAALESIGPHKRERLTRLAITYLNTRGWADQPHRIDIAAVDTRTRRVEIIEHAVGW
jgi:putative endonuclease